MLSEVDSAAYATEDEEDESNIIVSAKSNNYASRGKAAPDRQQGKKEPDRDNVAYTTLGTADLDETTFRIDDGNDTDSDISNGNGRGEDKDEDLLEPFPEIDHDRRPKEAGACEDDDASDEDADTSELKPGDHIYVWKSNGFFGVKTYQKHGIVLSVNPDADVNVGDPSAGVEVVTFYHKNHRHPSNRPKGDDVDDFGETDPYTTIDNHTSSTSAYTPNKQTTSTSTSTNSGDTKPKKEPKFTATVRVESLYAFRTNAKSPIRKVKYNQPLKNRILRRGGTVTSCRADEPGLVLARLKFLLDTNPEVARPVNSGGGVDQDGVHFADGADTATGLVGDPLAHQSSSEHQQQQEEEQSMPDFHMLSSNGECAAVWCRIGRWCTLQGSSILHILFVGQAGGAVAGGAIASNVMLWAPMPGVWGSIGYIWYVPATIAFPILVPVLIGFGLASLVPLELLRRFRKKWALISKEMNGRFWAYADDDVREAYFSSSASADENWMNQFFMDDAKKEEKKRGNYMPLGIRGVADHDDDDDDEEWTRKVAAEYGASSRDASEESEEEFRKKWRRKSMKEKWQNMKPFGKSNDAGKTPPGSLASDSLTSTPNVDVPLKIHDVGDGSCREIL